MKHGVALAAALSIGVAAADSSHLAYVADVQRFLGNVYDNHHEETNANPNFWRLVRPVGECMKAANRIVYYDGEIEHQQKLLSYANSEGDAAWAAEISEELDEARSLRPRAVGDWQAVRRECGDHFDKLENELERTLRQAQRQGIRRVQ